jgi:hypothetical protein
MKLIASCVLFIFVSFLATPTIVTLIEKNTDVSMFYSFAEEENHKEIKEVKASLNLGFEYPLIGMELRSNSKIISNNLLRHDKITEEIFIPPPDLI